ncbi:hypothetical protein K449DRAFT_387611 [Hypoxylon sp. EC38]|nr:hypothetical protein K449DRAFT_387611 [Hypoxylon sp. EC38]
MRLAMLLSVSVVLICLHLLTKHIYDRASSTWLHQLSGDKGYLMTTTKVSCQLILLDCLGLNCSDFRRCMPSCYTGHMKYIPLSA